MLMADGYREKRVAWEEKRKRREKREKKKRKKRRRRKELVWQGKDKTQTRAHNMNIFTKMPL